MRRAPPEYARGRGEGGWAAVALRGLRSAVSTRPHPALPARAALATRARVVPGRGPRAVDPSCAGRVASPTSPPGGALSGWGRLLEKPSRDRCGVRKSHSFSERFEFSVENDAVRDRWFGCVLFLSLFFFFFFFKALTHPRLWLSQCRTLQSAVTPLLR